MFKLAPLVVVALACTASHASSCDELRAQIEGKIKAAGVASFVVTVVDSAASAPGKVVGTCDKGAKKILYVQSPASGNPIPGSSTSAAKPTAASPGAPSKTSPSASPASPPASKAKAKTPDAAILTECKDGSTSIGGTCKP